VILVGSTIPEDCASSLPYAVVHDCTAAADQEYWADYTDHARDRHLRQARSVHSDDHKDYERVVKCLLAVHSLYPALERRQVDIRSCLQVRHEVAEVGHGRKQLADSQKDACHVRRLYAVAGRRRMEILLGVDMVNGLRRGDPREVNKDPIEAARSLEPTAAGIHHRQVDCNTTSRVLQDSLLVFDACCRHHNPTKEVQHRQAK
jgi:hypothetical protein